MLGFEATGRFALGQVSSPYIVTTLVADVGTFALTGQSALFATSTVADHGSFSLTGQVAILDRSFPAEVGAFILTGQDALLLPSLEAGVFTINGQDVNLLSLTVQTTRKALYRHGSSYWKGV